MIDNVRSQRYNSPVRPLESLFIFALFFYTTAIWSHRFSGTMKTWMLACFSTGLLADISGTIFLCVIVSDTWHWTLHSISGLIALLIMSLHFIWALAAMTRGGTAEEKFNRWSLWAWLIWLIAFVSGIPM